MSPAVISPIFSVLIPIVLGSRLWETRSTFFRLRTISVTSSTTPSIVSNSWSTPAIFTVVIAVPSIEERRTLRRALPIVCP